MNVWHPFLQNFFAAPNSATEKYSELFHKKDRADLVAAYVEHIADHKRALLLPYTPGTDAESQITTWYALTPDGNDLEILRESVESFIGPWPYGFAQSEQWLATPRGNEIDELVYEFTEGRFFTFQTHDAVKNEIETAIKLRNDVLRAYEHRPVRDGPLHPRDLFRNLETALLSHDREAAEQTFEELDTRGHLEEVNRLYLQVVMRGTFGQSQELLDDPQILDVVKSQPPNRVKEKLLTALYDVHIQPLEGDPTPTRAQTTFATTIHDTYGAVFKNQPPVRTKEVATLYGLHALTTGINNSIADLITEYIDHHPTNVTPLLTHTVEVLRETTPPDTAIQQTPSAEIAIQNRNYKEAITQAATMPTGPQKAKIILIAAYELMGDSGELMGDSGAATEALEHARLGLNELDALTTTDRDFLHETRQLRSIITELRTRISRPTSWNELLVRLHRNDHIPDLHAHLAETHLAIEAHNDTDSRNLTALILSDNPNVREQLADLTPRLIEDVARASQSLSRRSLLDVRLSLVTHLCELEAINPSQLENLKTLLDHLLDNGIPPSEYTDVIDYLLMLWEQHNLAAFPIHLPWAIEMVELISAFPIGNGAKAREFATAVILATQQNPLKRYLSPIQATILDDVIHDLDIHVPGLTPVVDSDPATSNDEDPSKTDQSPTIIERLTDALRKKTVGIYTLRERTGTRVKHVLEAWHPEITVIVRSDHQASKELAALSASADVMVITKRSAKHAATKCISESRPEGKPILEPVGVGSASIIESLSRHYLDLGEAVATP